MSHTPDDMCRRCAHYTPTEIFELCGAAASRYRSNERDELHTVSHMRSKACGTDAKLFQRAREAA